MQSLLVSDANASEKPTEDFRETGLCNLLPDSWQSARSEKQENMGKLGHMLLFFRKNSLRHAGCCHSYYRLHLSTLNPEPRKHFLK